MRFRLIKTHYGGKPWETHSKPGRGGVFWDKKRFAHLSRGRGLAEQRRRGWGSLGHLLSLQWKVEMAEKRSCRKREPGKTFELGKSRIISEACGWKGRLELCCRPECSEVGLYSMLLFMRDTLWGVGGETGKTGGDSSAWMRCWALSSSKTFGTLFGTLNVSGRLEFFSGFGTNSLGCTTILS